jgi:hypothetical protein
VSTIFFIQTNHSSASVCGFHYFHHQAFFYIRIIRVETAQGQNPLDTKTLMTKKLLAFFFHFYLYIRIILYFKFVEARLISALSMQEKILII